MQPLGLTGPPSQKKNRPRRFCGPEPLGSKSPGFPFTAALASPHSELLRRRPRPLAFPRAGRQPPYPPSSNTERVQAGSILAPCRVASASEFSSPAAAARNGGPPESGGGAHGVRAPLQRQARPARRIPPA